MSPPVATPHSTFEIPKPDFHSSHTFKSQESFDFSADSPTYTAGFSFSNTEKPHVSSRSRPRLMKIRRRQPTPRDGKTDLRINASSGFSGDKLGNVFGVNDRNSGSNGSGARTDSNGNMDRFGSGLAPGASLNGSSFDFGSGNGLFSSSMNSSTFNAQKETGSFMFGARKDCPAVNQKLPGECSFGVEKDTGGNLGQSEVNAQSVFGSDSYGSASQVKLGQQDSNKSGLGLNARFSSANVVSGAAKGGPSKIDSVNVDKSEADKVSGNRIPDVRGKVKLDTSGDSDKVCNPCSQFTFSSSDNSNKNGVNCVFGIDLGKKSTVRNRDMHDFTDSGIGKENADNGYLSQNACVNGVFVFGGFKGKGGFNSNGSTNPLNEVSEVNRVKADGCDGFGQHGRNSCSDVNSKFQSSGDSLEKEPAFSIKDKMNKLNIGDSEVDKKSGIFGGNFAVNTNNVFVVRGNQKNSDFVKENKPSMSQKTPEVGRSTHNNSESDRASSSFFSSAGIGVELNGGFCEVPSMNKVEKDSLNFTGILGGLDSSSADYSTPNLKFDFSKNNLFPGINKLDNSNLRSLGSKKSKKKNGKLRRRTVVQDLFRQNHASEGNVQQNHESPGYGSPMDFSPYQDKSTNAPVADTGAGIKDNLPTSENHISEHCEKPRDDVSTLNFSLSSTAKDGLSALHTQYKKKYKLKVRSNPTIQTNNPVKENAKQEPSGTTIHEACEQWRIRGNEAYHAGQLSKAEEFYSMGINSAPHISAIGYSMKSLLLCYSNRAATRMSLGRMREAIEDCTKASELDPDFLKATLRAGNCYLVLGEVEEAIICYTKCLSDGTSICLDRRVTIEAADGLNKAKKVAEQMLQSANLLQEGSDDAATSAMGIIEEALLISRFSERLLQMKGEVLYTLRMYDKVIQLCERTLDVAQKNLSLDNHKCKNSHVKLWRWHLQAKSHFRLGKLDSALDLIEKQENLSFSSKSGDETRDSAIALAANIRELLSLKKSGNEAFSSGRYTEAIENYTSAISKSYESRGFMAICFCNRAAAYQSLGQIIDAISDCSIAIALDENYVKAISRRATLHEMIRDYKQAIYDLQKLVSLLESQSQTKNQARSSGGSVRDLRKARRRLSLAEEKAKKEISLDLYLILGIKQSDTESEIKKAYRKAALRHHPDKAGQVLARNDVADDGTLRKEFGEKIHTDADRLFKVIGEAYAVLSDPSKRSKYDNEEEMRKIYRDSNRNSNSEHPSTSYTSPFERGNSYGRQSGYSNTRRYWYEAKSNSNSRW